MANRGYVGRGIMYLPTAARPTPDLLRRAGPTRPAPPPRAPRCALDQLRGGGRVCYGDVPGVIHNEHCPQARREARERQVWGWVMAGLTILAFVTWGLAAIVSIAARTCGIGAVC